MSKNEKEVRALFKQLMKEAEEQKNHRAMQMPTEMDAVRQIYGAFQRLKDLGWKEAVYCPKDGTAFKAIEAGCLGIQTRCTYEGELPHGCIFSHDEHDSWPSRAILFKRIEQ